jgi:hypothetical protein
MDVLILLFQNPIEIEEYASFGEGLRMTELGKIFYSWFIMKQCIFQFRGLRHDYYLYFSINLN